MMLKKSIVISLLLLCGCFVRSSAQTIDAKLEYEKPKLYSIVNNQRYYIDETSLKDQTSPNAVIDPSKQSIFYVQNTGCGFENEGTTVFR